MPNLNLSKQFGSSLKSQLDLASGNLSKIGEAGGKGAFSVGAGPNGLSINANFNSLVQNKMEESKANGPLKNLYPAGKGIYRFPMDIDDENYMIISVLKRDRVASNTRSKNKRVDAARREPIENYVLPIPNNLVSTHDVGYNNANLGIAGGIASGNIGVAEGKELIGASVNMVGQITEDAKRVLSGGESDGTVSGIGTATAGIAVAGLATAIAARAGGGIAALLAAGSVGEGLGAGLSTRTGVAINPHMAVIFDGMNFREHQFTYKFIARHQGESMALYKIIRGLEYYMLPSYTAGRLGFEYPNEFRIEFSQKHEDYLYEIGECVLKNMTVTYNGEGVPVFYEQTGAPVSVEISLSFQETKIVTRESME